MKTRALKILMLSVVLLMFAGGLTSCEKKKESDPITSLKNTKWKLAGIVDAETSVLTELDPKDCKKCYTLTFDTDSSFSTFSSSNELGGSYTADYETYSFQILDFGGTKVGETGDGNLYSDLFWHRQIHYFSIFKNELKLYYNDKKNYLLLKSK